MGYHGELYYMHPPVAMGNNYLVCSSMMLGKVGSNHQMTLYDAGSNYMNSFIATTQLMFSP